MKPTLPEPVKRLTARIDGMSLRERAILFVALLAVLFLLADQVLFPTLRVQQKESEKQISAKLAQLTTINSQIERIVTENSQDPDARARARLAELRQQFASLEINAADITRGLVTPREMTRLVHQMLQQNRTLELVKAENLPPEALALEPAGTTGSATGSGAAPAVYRHGLRIEVKGRYPDIVRYLRALEQLSWRVIWGEIRITTEHYPYSQASLTIYTLSLDKAWIGL